MGFGREIKPREHSNNPLQPKFRMEGVTPSRIAAFFSDYEAGTLPHYYKPASLLQTPVVRDGIRELSGWDFVEFVNDPSSCVLVAFVSANCNGCTAFGALYKDLASQVQALRKKKHKSHKWLDNLKLARIDQTANEHP